MNETIKVIRSRRSIRAYKPDPPKEEELKTIVEAGVYAPTAMNQQKWHFTVVEDKAVLAKMAANARENVLTSGIDFLAERAKDPNFNCYNNAPVVIVITAEADNKFAEFDCGCAAENMALTAESLGIGTVMMGMPEFALQGEAGEALKKELGIPAGYRHVISLGVGYKVNPDTPMPEKKFDVINYVK